MEGDISSIVQTLHLIAHVFEEELIFVQVNFQTTSQQAEQKLHPRGWNHSLYQNQYHPDLLLMLVSETFIYHHKSKYQLKQPREKKKQY